MERHKRWHALPRCESSEYVPYETAKTQRKQQLPPSRYTTHSSIVPAGTLSNIVPLAMPKQKHKLVKYRTRTRTRTRTPKWRTPIRRLTFETCSHRYGTRYPSKLNPVKRRAPSQTRSITLTHLVVSAIHILPAIALTKSRVLALVVGFLRRHTVRPWQTSICC